MTAYNMYNYFVPQTDKNIAIIICKLLLAHIGTLAAKFMIRNVLIYWYYCGFDLYRSPTKRNYINQYEDIPLSQTATCINSPIK